MERREDQNSQDKIARVPVNKQLAEPEEGIAGRILDQTKALTQDFSSLVELRLKKAQIEIEERIETRINSVSANIIFAVLGGLAGLFVLIAISFALGDLLGHVAWGFLVTGVVLGLLGFVIKSMHPKLVKIGDKRAVIEEDNLAANAPKGRLHQAKSNP